MIGFENLLLIIKSFIKLMSKCSSLLHLLWTKSFLNIIWVILVGNYVSVYNETIKNKKIIPLIYQTIKSEIGKTKHLMIRPSKQDKYPNVTILYETMMMTW